MLKCRQYPATFSPVKIHADIYLAPLSTHVGARAALAFIRGDAMNLRQYTALSLVLALLCAPAVAGQKPASGSTPAAPVVLTPEHFEHLDTNRDGVLSEAEYQQ